MLPALMHLANAKLTEAHWASVLDPIGIQTPIAELTVKCLKSGGALEVVHLQLLATISTAASAEAGADAVVECVMHDWDHRELAISQVWPDLDMWGIGDQTEDLDLLDG